jgi:TRAP transporter TAXI family solute receptor
MKRKRFISVFLIIAMVVIALVGCQENSTEPVKENETKSGNEKTDGKERPDALVIASGSSAGTYYYMATGQSKILSENIEGLSVTNEATNGTINFDLASANVDTIGMGGLEQFLSAVEGREDRGYPVPLDNLGIIQTGHKFVLYCVTTANSGIETLADLNGKKIGRPSLTGSSTPMIDMLYEAYGVDPDTLTETPSTHAENVDALKDGVIDAAFVAGGVPMAGVTDLTTTHDVKLLDIDEELIAPYMKEHSYFDLITIEPGTYNKQDKPVNLLTVDVLLAANMNLDDDLVYEITKTLNENVEEMALIHNDGSQWNAENTLNVYNKNIAPFHPGAARYYDEINKKE